MPLQNHATFWELPKFYLVSCPSVLPLLAQFIKQNVTLQILEEIFHYEGDEVQEQVAQRSCGCPIPEMLVNK